MPIAPECVRVPPDGQLLSGKTTVDRGPEQPRFRVQLPPETAAISVSYLESRRSLYQLQRLAPR